MASDGKVLISTELDNSALPKGINQVKGQLGGLGNVVKKLGGVVAAAFSVKAIADFAKECIDLGSDLQEVQNVVDVTFTTMNEQVNEFARNAAKTAGLSETMAKKYAGTFGAMAKSFKFTEAEAYEMSTALTQLSGDVASFYNLSQDEAYTKLKSVFTGETESLKDLGVVMTQTALDNFALQKGLGKTTSQMTEQEKVALRYQFVMEQLAGASGDFLRTSDSWANQTKLLSLQFDSLKASLGQGLINALTPAIKLINTFMSQLQGAADAFRDFTAAVFGSASSSVEKAADGYSDAAQNAGELAENTEEAGKAAKKALASFDELNVLSGSDKDSSGSSLGNLTYNSVSIGTVEDNATPQMQEIVDKILGTLEPLEKISFQPAVDAFGNLKEGFSGFADAVVKGLEWAWPNLLTPLAEWTVEKAAPELIEALGGAFSLLGTVAEKSAPFLKAVWDSFLSPLMSFAGDVVIGTISGLGDVFYALSGKTRDLSGEMATLTEEEQKIVEKADLAKESFDKLREKTNGSTEAIMLNQEKVKALAGELHGLADENGRVQESDQNRVNFILGELNSALGTEYEMVGGVITGYSELKGSIDEAIKSKTAYLLIEAKNEEYVAALTNEQEAWESLQISEKAYNDQKKLTEEGVRDRKKQIEDLDAKIRWCADRAADAQNDGNVAAAAYFGMLQTAHAAEKINLEREVKALETALADKKSAYEDDKAEYEGYQKAITDYDTAMRLSAEGNYQAVIDLFGKKAGAYEEAMAEMAKDSEDYGKEMADGVAKGFKSVTKQIQSTLEKSFGVRISGFDKSYVSSISSTPSLYSVASTVDVPYLAKGAVIPANRQFMAVLGDQRHGTNIEAPLATIQEALANVLAESGQEVNVNITFSGDLAQLARVLKPAIDQETVRKGRSLAKVVTG